MAASNSPADSTVTSDAGLETTAAGQEEVPVVDARKAFLIKLALDVFFWCI
ncbi:hypothetical protein C2845_PM01G25720 [Panicum miliaceum]|uniref:Uncharacterized protein n=1 Tax=Panicum miliaceum TaxID=4540 RepID=A0A3L6TEP1_PANMI|nr:hypothetical protein C2845_PM01G25720 [Panicum miliaceum]